MEFAMVTEVMQALAFASLLQLILSAGRPMSVAHASDTFVCPPKRQCMFIDDCIDIEGRTGAVSKDCGYVGCNQGICELNAFIDGCSAHFVYCNGDDSKCTKGPSLLIDDVNHFKGFCAGWNRTECVYRWCVPEAAIASTAEPTSTQAASLPAENLTLSSTTTTSTISSAITTTADTPDGCTTAHDCVADPGKPPLTDCGNVRCVEGSCEFDAYEDTKPECKEFYHVFCNADHSKCTKGPARSVGVCIHLGFNECTYVWIPTSRAGGADPSPTSTTPSSSTPVPLSSSTTIGPLETTQAAITSTTSSSVLRTGCSEPRHCIADPSKPPLHDCGTVRCVAGRCEYDAWENQKQECLEYYFSQCNGDHLKCKKGPEGSVGTCSYLDKTACTYTWFNKGSPHL